jgi:hypothetical protein
MRASKRLIKDDRLKRPKGTSADGMWARRDFEGAIGPEPKFASRRILGKCSRSRLLIADLRTAISAKHARNEPIFYALRRVVH